MHQIENEFLKVIAREAGAELTSVYDKKHGMERLWQADAKVWGWHAPVLFPVIGRCLNDEITIDGTKYPMQKHGFGRRSNFKLQDLEGEKITFSMSDNAETLKSYPYRFEFLIGYGLKDKSLHIKYEVRNLDDKPIYFSLGGHPAFIAPLFAHEKYEDYYIEFEQNETVDRHFVDMDGFFDGRTERVLTNSNKIYLRGDLFKDDALIFKDLKSRKATLKSESNAHHISIDFSGFKYLGLWAKTNAPYVCIEPWLGCADTFGAPSNFKNKEGIISVKSGAEFTTSFTVKID